MRRLAITTPGIHGALTRQATTKNGGIAMKTVDDTKVTSKTLRALLESQDYCCALTGVQLEPSTASLDHKVAISKGGSDTIENCQIVHKVVNRMKTTLSVDEFVHWCQLVASQSQTLGSP